jgi:O-antigen ligase
MLLTAGTVLNLGRLPYVHLINRQEAIYLAYLAWLILSRMLTGKEVEQDYLDKTLKMSVFLLALSHVVVTPRRYRQFSWLLILCALYLGYEARNVPRSDYQEGRLNGGVGGPDFRDSNALAAHVVALLPFVGVQFLRSGWKGKVLCLVTGALAVNTIVLTRSRAAFLAIVVGILSALVLAPKGGRKKVWPLVVLAGLGSLALVDTNFVQRMKTIESRDGRRDDSAQDRIRSWEAGMGMFQDNLIGVGVGNFGAHMGNYLENHEGRDAHNTYVRCAAELGIPGVILLAALIANGFLTLTVIGRPAAGHPESDDPAWDCFGLKLSLIMYLVVAFFSSFNYVEMFSWMIILPAALERVVANAKA